MGGALSLGLSHGKASIFSLCSHPTSIPSWPVSRRSLKLARRTPPTACWDPRSTPRALTALAAVLLSFTASGNEARYLQVCPTPNPGYSASQPPRVRQTSSLSPLLPEDIKPTSRPLAQGEPRCDGAMPSPTPSLDLPPGPWSHLHGGKWALHFHPGSPGGPFPHRGSLPSCQLWRAIADTLAQPGTSTLANGSVRGKSASSKRVCLLPALPSCLLV